MLHAVVQPGGHRADTSRMAGESAGNIARATEAAAARYRAKAERLERRAAAYAKGEAGEVAVGELLCELATDGWYHLPDRALPGSPANIDHIAVGPAGVLVVDAKNWDGSVSLDNGVLCHNGRRRAEAGDMTSYAATVATAVGGSVGALPLHVHPVVCFVGRARIGGVLEAGLLRLVDGDELHHFVRALPATLARPQVERALVAVIQAFPPRTGAVPEPLPAEEPAESVVFLRPWRKHGKYRMYVKRGDGNDMGCLDLLTGKVQADRHEDEVVLQQLLPHYLKGDMPGTGAEDVNAEERGVMTRLLNAFLGKKPRRPEQPVITCSLWQKHDMKRLYVHRIEPGGEKVELGWVDPSDDRHHAADAAARSVLGFCSRRFREIEKSRTTS